MGIIELATQRLEELRRSGIDVPGQASGAQRASSTEAEETLLVRAARRLEQARPLDGSAPGHAGDVAPAEAEERPAPARGRPPADDAPDVGRRVEIDLKRLDAMGYLTSLAPRAQIASDFRVVKRELLTNVSDHVVPQANLIMVTSALPNEGKTFVAVNLAMSMAMEVDRRILLVDADVARPSVFSRLGLPPAEAGFLDVLEDPSVHLPDVMLRTSIDKLTLLPGGAPRAHATEMLASDTMNRLLHELSSQYADRVIVFDAPPLLPSTESRVLATRMGQVVLVVEAKRTPKKAVEQALATVETCQMVLPLLNKATRSEVGSYYGYYGLAPD